MLYLASKLLAFSKSPSWRFLFPLRAMYVFIFIFFRWIALQVLRSNVYYYLFIYLFIFYRVILPLTSTEANQMYKDWKTVICRKRACTPLLFQKPVPLLCIFSSHRWVGQWDTPGHAQLVRCEPYSPPMPLYFVLRGVSPLQECTPYNEGQGSKCCSAWRPGSPRHTQSLTLSLYLNPASGHVFQRASPN